jgi:hypothetical protein
MGILDDIKNMKPLPDHKWTLEELLKVEKKILKKGQKSILKQLLKMDNINKNKNNVIYQREKVEQDGDDERRNAI